MESNEKIQLWEDGLKSIEAKYIDFFKNALNYGKNVSDIEDFMIVEVATGKYSFISVAGIELPAHIKSEVNSLAKSIFPQ